MNLFEIGEEIYQALMCAVDQETGEIIDEEAKARFDALSLQQDKKIEGIALFVKNLTAEAEAIKTEKMAMAKRQVSAERKAEWLKGYLAAYLNGEKFSTGRVAIGWRKSEQVQVTIDAENLPEAYRKVTYEANKTELKNALKGGVEIDGVELVQKNSIQIK